jgi:hypothetical protein
LTAFSSSVFYQADKKLKFEQNISMKNRKIAFTALAVCLLLPADACKNKKNEAVLQDVVYREDSRSVYDEIGARVTIDMVEEREDGKAYVVVDGVEYELGMDFLSMAMVYNVRPVGAFTTPTKAYNEWWRLYMQRWNLLVPEVPLYSNQYYDIYNAKIDKLETSPYWDVTDAIVGAKVISGDNSVILGSNTELSGAFRNSSFGKSAPGAADLDIETLTSGYSTVVTNKGGNYEWADEGILASHTETENADGTRTFTMRIANDLTFSDGSPIRAENYLVALLVGSTKVMKEAGGGDSAGQTLVGYEAFNAYEGRARSCPLRG